MSKRITSDFAPTLLDTYGNVKEVIRGRKGEELAMSFYQDKGLKVIDCECDKTHQLDGIDFIVKYPSSDQIPNNERSISVKSNLHSPSDLIKIELDAFSKCKATAQMHVDPKSGYVVEYVVHEMRNLLMKSCTTWVNSQAQAINVLNDFDTKQTIPMMAWKNGHIGLYVSQSIAQKFLRNGMKKACVVI